MPLLELDDGTCIAEAMAICRYFEELYPEPPLMGADAREKALIDMWESFTGRALPGAPEPVEQIPDLVERGKKRMGWFYKKFDDQLETNEFVAGDRFSVADITTLCSVDFARFCRLEIPESCGNVARWHASVSARPSAQL